MLPAPAASAIDPASRKGQACDRCRRRKVRCDGKVPACANCLAAGHACEASTTLQRNRKVRGFVDDDAERQASQLRDEVALLRRQLEDEKKANEELRKQLQTNSNTRAPPQQQNQPFHGQDGQASSQPPQPHAPAAKLQRRKDAAYMLKHMGRMVHDEHGIGRFAGITTGAHFLQSLEAVWAICVGGPKQPFPESCYRLFLSDPTSDLSLVGASESPWGMILADQALPSTAAADIARLLNQPLNYYVQQAHVFLSRWEVMCPLLIPSELARDLTGIAERSQDGSASTQTSEPHYSIFMTTCMILAINELEVGSQDNPEAARISPDFSYISLACRLRPIVAARGSLKSLQALCLYAFYHQITGQASKLADLSGLLVRMAQSLALHRHARRFKLSVGEIEHRKRLFWWVYIFDKISALVLGLPSLINEANVDVDLPTDCLIEDMDATELSIPLPGSITAVFFFNQYIGLARIMSSVQSSLYTTKERHEGPEKITHLNRDLQIWSHTLDSHPDVTPFDITQTKDTTLPSLGDASYDMALHWLRVLANLICLFINRPGLTFDPTTKDFAKCLALCLKSSSCILDFLGVSVLPRKLRCISPLGPNMAFQAALMHIYGYCMSDPSRNNGEGAVISSTVVLRTIAEALTIMEHYMEEEMRVAVQGTARSFYLTSLSDAITTLRGFVPPLQTLHSPQNAGSGPSSILNRSETGYTPSPSVIESFSRSFDPALLESLNYMESLDWIEPDIAGFVDHTMP